MVVPGTTRCVAIHYGNRATAPVVISAERNGCLTLRRVADGLPVVTQHICGHATLPSAASYATHATDVPLPNGTGAEIWSVWSCGTVVTTRDTGACSAVYRPSNRSPANACAALLAIPLVSPRGSRRVVVIFLMRDGHVVLLDSITKLCIGRSVFGDETTRRSSFVTAIHVSGEPHFLCWQADGAVLLGRLTWREEEASAVACSMVCVQRPKHAARPFHVTSQAVFHSQLRLGFVGTNGGTISSVALDIDRRNDGPLLARRTEVSVHSVSSVVISLALSVHHLVSAADDGTILISEMATLLPLQRVRLGGDSVVCESMIGIRNTTDDEVHFVALLSNGTLRLLTIEDQAPALQEATSRAAFAVRKAPSVAANREIDDSQLLPREAASERRRLYSHSSDLESNEIASRAEIASERDDERFGICRNTMHAALEGETSARREVTLLQRLVSSLEAEGKDAQMKLVQTDQIVDAAAKAQWTAEELAKDRDAVQRRAAELQDTLTARQLEVERVNRRFDDRSREMLGVMETSDRRALLHEESNRFHGIATSASSTRYEMLRQRELTVRHHLESCLASHDELAHTTQSLRERLEVGDQHTRRMDRETVDLSERLRNAQFDAQESEKRAAAEEDRLKQRCSQLQAVADEQLRQIGQHGEISASSFAAAKEATARYFRCLRTLDRVADAAETIVRLCEANIVAATEIPTLSQARALLRDAQFDLAAARRGLEVGSMGVTSAPLPSSQRNMSPQRDRRERGGTSSGESASGWMRVADACEKLRILHEHCFDSKSMNCVVLDRKDALDVIHQLRLAIEAAREELDVGARTALSPTR